MNGAPLDMIRLVTRSKSSVERVIAQVVDQRSGQIIRRPIKRIGVVVWPWTPQTYTDDMAQMVEDLRKHGGIA